jgi:hypothetical protein
LCLSFKLAFIDLLHEWRALMVLLLVFEVTLYEVEDAEHSQGKQEKLIGCHLSLLLRGSLMLDPYVVLINDHFNLGHFVEEVAHRCGSDRHQQLIGLAVRVIYLLSHLIVLDNQYLLGCIYLLSCQRSQLVLLPSSDWPFLHILDYINYS